MAKRKSGGGSVTALQNQKKRLKAQLTAINKRKRDAAKAAKLKREVASLKKQVSGKKKK